MAAAERATATPTTTSPEAEPFSRRANRDSKHQAANPMPSRSNPASAPPCVLIQIKNKSGSKTAHALRPSKTRRKIQNNTASPIALKICGRAANPKEISTDAIKPSIHAMLRHGHVRCSAPSRKAIQKVSMPTSVFSNRIPAPPAKAWEAPSAISASTSWLIHGAPGAVHENGSDFSTPPVFSMRWPKST